MHTFLAMGPESESMPHIVNGVLRQSFQSIQVSICNQLTNHRDRFLLVISTWVIRFGGGAAAVSAYLAHIYTSRRILSGQTVCLIGITLDKVDVRYKFNTLVLLPTVHQVPFKTFLLYRHKFLKDFGQNRVEVLRRNTRR
jgi:hypothetical protein